MRTRLPWTKFQDFYLRLGFLKVLVGVLSPERRSAANDALLRRLERPLFENLSTHPTLLQTASPAEVEQRGGGFKEAALPSVVVSALASDHSVGSALHAITKPTAYKVLDWGHDLDFLGRANQISERALILQSLLPRERVERFFAGDPTQWNPFRLELRERVFFLYHLIECDLLTVELIVDLGNRNSEAVIEAREAERMTCAALFRVLEVTDRLDAVGMRQHRVALDLALTMAEEVEAPVPPQWSRRAQRVHAARIQKASAKRTARPATRATGIRKTTKNADHQTIPRFEQLVDLGFLSKPDGDAEDSKRALAARKRWQYQATQACRRWKESCAKHSAPISPEFRWCDFAAVAVETFGEPAARRSSPSLEEIARRVWLAYRAVGRAVGLSPVESIALRAMVDAVAEGVPLEMQSVHQLFMRIKQRGILTDCVFFAAGNALNTMFVRIKPTFPQQVREAVEVLSQEMDA